jgi:hypothetical protein
VAVVVVGEGGVLVAGPIVRVPMGVGLKRAEAWLVQVLMMVVAVGVAMGVSQGFMAVPVQMPFG